MRKILILGGANQHVKYVESAHHLGLYVIVTDYLPIEKSPAKQVADEHWEFNITDIDSIVSKCREENVSAVISGHLDPCQVPYATICEKLGLPCYATVDMFTTFTNKISFKELCIACGVDVIPDYSIDDVLSCNVDYPVFVKPSDSRGSRGQSICYTLDEVLKAIEIARSESSDGKFLIERYFGDYDELQITYFVIRDEVYLVRTVDAYRGSHENHLNRVVCCSISPSIYTKLYLNSAHENMVKMIKQLGIHNGPVFAQCFCDGTKFYFFDPGLRFPGVEYERIYKLVYGIDFPEFLIRFSLTGEMPETSLPADSYNLTGKYAAIFFPAINKGRVDRVVGLEDYKQHEGVVCCSTRYQAGDIVPWSANVNQRFAEVVTFADGIEELKKLIIDFQDSVRVLDCLGQNMLFDPFNPIKIKQK